MEWSCASLHFIYLLQSYDNMLHDTMHLLLEVGGKVSNTMLMSTTGDILPLSL